MERKKKKKNQTNKKQHKELNIWSLTSELMLPACLKGWVCYWLRWQSFWTIWEIKQMSRSWRTNIVLDPLLSKWGEWNRNLIIGKCSCFQCWEKSFSVKNVLWTKHNKWTTKSQFLYAVPTCMGTAPVLPIKATHPTEDRAAATRQLLTSLYGCRQRAGTQQMIFHVKQCKTG